MNRVFNWTFGSVFRTIGRVIGYLLVGALLGLILQKNGVRLRDLFPILRVSAKEFNTTEQYRIYKCDAHNDYENCNFTSWTNVGTATSNSTSSTVVRGFSMNFAQNETLNAGGHYRVYIAFDIRPNNTGANNLTNYNCFGVNSNSTSGGEDTNIQSCELQTIIPTSSGITYIFDVVPAINIKSIKINIYMNTGEGYTSVKGLAKSNLSNDTSTSDAINNMSDDIINNQNQNTQDIIDNQTKLNTVCKNLSISDAPLDGYIAWDGTFHEQYGANKSTNFINIQNVNSITLLKKANTNKYACFYDIDKTMIRCDDTSTLSTGYKFNIPTNAVYFRSNFEISDNLPVYSICSNGNSAINDSINNLNDSINDDNVSSSTNQASSFFSNFTTNTHGLTGIITAPLNAINSLTSATCSPLVLPLPFVNQNLTLPCMRQIYTDNFGGFMQIYDVIVIGIIAYWICVRIFGLVKDFKNPEHDEIEVVDL